MRKNTLILIILVVVVVGYFFWQSWVKNRTTSDSPLTQQGLAEPLIPSDREIPELVNELQIEHMRSREYPGSDIQIIDELASEASYLQFIVSYESDGNTIYALMTVSNGEKPETGWPVIIFNHGYIPPDQYQTTQRYGSYVDYFARNGYIVFKSDYRGHGSSEGNAEGGYGSPAYTIDILNALSSLQRFSEADPNRIGMWGHSMGGFVTVRSMVIDPDIKAGVIWGGVVVSYSDLLNNWRRRSGSPRPLPSGARRWREVLQETYGTPEANPEFWNSISANSYLQDISGPVQLHHAKGDASVPWEFSQTLANQLAAVGQVQELFLYEGDDHDITANFNRAMKESLAFFDRYVKGGE